MIFFLRSFLLKSTDHGFPDAGSWDDDPHPGTGRDQSYVFNFISTFMARVSRIFNDHGENSGKIGAICSRVSGGIKYFFLPLIPV